MTRKVGLVLAAAASLAGLTVIAGIVLIVANYDSLFQPRELHGPVAIVQGPASKHGLMGLEFQSSENDARTPKSPLTISSVLPKTGAADAGLLPGDVLIQVEEKSEPGYDELTSILRTRKPGSHLSITVRREGEEKLLDLSVRLMRFDEIIAIRQQQRGAVEPIPVDESSSR